jgi:hypothetical protein
MFRRNKLKQESGSTASGDLLHHRIHNRGDMYLSHARSCGMISWAMIQHLHQQNDPTAERLA